MLVPSSKLCKRQRFAHPPYVICGRAFEGDIELFPSPAVRSIAANHIFGLERLNRPNLVLATLNRVLLIINIHRMIERPVRDTVSRRRRGFFFTKCPQLERNRIRMWIALKSFIIFQRLADDAPLHFEVGMFCDGV